MAHLLGSKYCIESLRNDVTDLQGAVVDIFSRVGPVRYPSWKYPDKFSCDVDVTELLDIHEYSEEEEERQVAHIVLLELVIDRLVLLLQSLSKFTDQILTAGRGVSAQPSSNTSIGLVVKKYWAKIVQLSTQVQNVRTENKNKSRTIADLEDTMTKLLDNEARTHTASGSPQITIPLNEADAMRLRTGSATSVSNYSISRDECIKSTQTLETAFVPCESCDMVQKHFREVSDVVVNICTTQDLPSSLAKHKGKMEKVEWMCGTDVARWAVEQNKDLNRINKYLSSLHSTIEPMKIDMTKAQTAQKQLQNRLSECVKEVVLERETQDIQRKQYENKLKDMENKTQDDIAKIERRNTELIQSKEKIESQILALKNQAKIQETLIQELDAAKKQVVQQMEEKMTNNEDVKKLESEIESKEEAINEVKDKLLSAHKELDREKAKNKSVTKHTESMLGKQEGLVHRLDDIDRENEDLRNQISDLEEQQGQMEQQLENIKEDKRQLTAELRENKAMVNCLTKEKEALEKTTLKLREDIHQMELQVEEAQEHERLLVEFPDLNGPVNTDLRGTGDLVKDMENQVQANTLRIRILEEQNTKLRNSVTKMLQSHSHNRTEMPVQPVPLWKVEESVIQDEPDGNCGYEEESNFDSNMRDNSQCHWESSRSPPSKNTQKISSRPSKNGEKSLRESFVISPGPKSVMRRPPSGKSSKSSKGAEAPNSSSIGAYMKLKKSGLLTGQRPSSGKPVVPSGERLEYVPTETFSCTKCDKMYNSMSDLDIHKSYCYGGS